MFLARTDQFADAVAGGSLTSGPTLLVDSCNLVPAAILDEVRRLGAGTVTALGGARAVCDGTLNQVAGA